MSSYDIGDECPDIDCDGKFIAAELEGSCSCHIHPPCSHCCNGMIECNECGLDHDSMASYSSENTFVQPKAWKKLTMADLKKGEFNYLTITGAYYFTEHEGYYPEGWSAEELKSNFNLCFGYTNFSMKDGKFKIKVYTD